MDAAAAGAWAQAVAGFAGVGAVIYAANKGAATVRDWLGQKSAERQIDAAERILSIAYRLKREFPAIRSPGVLVGEQLRAEALLRESDPGFEIRPEPERHQMIHSQVYVTRLVDRKGLWDELFVCLPLATAHFGAEVEEALNALWTARGKVDVAARMLARENLGAELRNRLEGDIWDGWNAVNEVDDPINVLINTSISTLDTWLLPVLRASQAKERADKKKAPR